MNASVDMIGAMPNGSSTFSGSMGGMQSSDDGSKKIRKPYTITKARESWTDQEHDKFLEALQRFDRDWKKIEAFVGSKTVIQIRSHAQKYFLKVQKNGTGEHVPPPRPKRKANQPYPQKASKTVLVAHAGLMGRTMKPQTTQSEPCFARHGNFPSSSIGSNSGSWQYHSMPPVGQVTPDLRCDIPAASIKPVPDFAEVYKFIGNVFDPDSNGHLKKLKEMAPIDRETVLLLMRNLSINLSNPELEEHNLSPLPCDANLSEQRRACSEHRMSMSVPSATQANSDGGDDDSAVSGQPAPKHLSGSVDSDSHWDPSHRTRVMPGFSDGAKEAPQQHRQSYDGGSKSMGSVLPTNYSPLIGSRPMLDMSSMGVHRTMVPHSHPHMAAFGGGRGFAMPLPAVTAGVEGGFDGWWS